MPGKEELLRRMAKDCERDQQEELLRCMDGSGARGAQ